MAKSRTSKRSASKKGRRRLTRKEFQAFVAKDAEFQRQINALTKVQEWLRIAGDKTKSMDERLRALHEADKVGTGLDAVRKLLARLRGFGSVH